MYANHQVIRLPRPSTRSHGEKLSKDCFCGASTTSCTPMLALCLDQSYTEETCGEHKQSTGNFERRG